MNKWVMISNGPFKGQRGLVTHVNGDTVTLETSIRAKKVHVERSDLREINANELGNQGGGGQGAQYAGQNNIPESQYAGDMTTYGGGQTAYDVGKTNYAANDN